MLSKSKRLDKKAFLGVVKTGRVIHSTNIYLKLSETGQDYSRFSVSAPKKAIKEAVKRNFARRRVYSILNSFWPKVKGGFDGIFFCRDIVAFEDFGLLKKEIEALLAKAGVLM